MVYTINRAWLLKDGRIRWEYNGKIKRPLKEEIAFYEGMEKPQSTWVGIRIKEKETGKIVYERMF